MSNCRSASIKNGNSSYESHTVCWLQRRGSTNECQTILQCTIFDTSGAIYLLTQKKNSRSPPPVTWSHFTVRKKAGKDTSFRLLPVTELLLQWKIPGSDLPARLYVRRETHAWALAVSDDRYRCFNPLNPELNPICYLLALLGDHHFLHVSRIRVKLLTLRRLMSYIYIYGAPILDVSRSHTTTQHSR